MRVSGSEWEKSIIQRLNLGSAVLHSAGPLICRFLIQRLIDHSPSIIE